MIATEKHYAFRGRLMSLLVLTHCGVSSRPLGLGLRTARPIENHCDYSSHLKHLLPQESPCFSFASLSLLTTDCGSNSNIKTSYDFTSPGEWRAVTPGSAITQPTENICGNSTCPKTPQSGFLEEAKAVPAESIRPDRSRTAAITHVLANQHALTSQFIDFVSKTTIIWLDE